MISNSIFIYPALLEKKFWTCYAVRMGLVALRQTASLSTLAWTILSRRQRNRISRLKINSYQSNSAKRCKWSNVESLSTIFCFNNWTKVSIQVYHVIVVVLMKWLAYVLFCWFVDIQSCNFAWNRVGLCRGLGAPADIAKLRILQIVLCGVNQNTPGGILYLKTNQHKQWANSISIM